MRQIETENSTNALTKLHALKRIISTTKGKAILRQIDRKKSELLARHSGFDLVEGNYYERTQTVSNF